MISKPAFLFLLLQVPVHIVLGQWNLSASGVDIYNSNSGKVGIGTAALEPASKLEVNGTISMVRGNRLQFLETVGGTPASFIEGDISNKLKFFVGSGTGMEAMVIDADGNTSVNGELFVHEGAQVSSYLTDTNPDFSWGYNLMVRNVNNDVNTFSRLTFVSQSGGMGAITVRKMDTYKGDMHLQVRNSAGSYSTPMIIKSDGNIGIGTDNPAGYKLAVAGKAVAEEVVVKLKANWPDYVFDTDYELPALSTLEQFIIENRHLPDVPTEQEVKEHGLRIGEMNAILLKKVEELTLHLIEMNKKIQSLEERNCTLEARIEELVHK